MRITLYYMNKEIPCISNIIDEETISELVNEIITDYNNICYVSIIQCFICWTYEEIQFASSIINTKYYEKR